MKLSKSRKKAVEFAVLDRQEFLRELKLIGLFVFECDYTPILANVLIEVSSEELSMRATNLELSLKTGCKTKTASPAQLAVNARRLVQFLEASTSDEVSLSSCHDRYLTLRAGSAKLRIRTTQAEEFPDLPTPAAGPVARIPLPTLQAMIPRVFFAISDDRSRFQISGANLSITKNALTLVATDGHRLALVESAVGKTQGDTVIGTVPREALEKLSQLEGECLEVQLGVSHFVFTCGYRQVICKLGDGTFPSYERVLSQVNDRTLVLSRKALHTAVRQVAVGSPEHGQELVLEIASEGLKVSACDPDFQIQAQEVVESTLEGEGLKISVNPSYLEDYLASTDAEALQIEALSEESMLVLSTLGCPELRHVCAIMPLRTLK